MVKTVSMGSISLVDLNDIVASATAPVKPTAGVLWMDTTTNTLKRWTGTAWVNQQMDIKNLDPELAVVIENAVASLGTMANDNVLNLAERQQLKDDLSNIIGKVMTNTEKVLPTVAQLDASVKGAFYSVRRSALNAGIQTTNQAYVNVATEYQNLKIYLESLANDGEKLSPWDTSVSTGNKVITVSKDVFRDKWLQYYLATETLNLATTRKIREDAEATQKELDDLDVGIRNWTRNGNLAQPLEDSAWKSNYIGTVKERVDISTEAPPHKYALHVKNNTSVNGGVYDAVIWDGEEANSLKDKKVTLSTWVKYSGMAVGGTNGLVLRLTITGQKPDGTFVSTHPTVWSSGAGTNTTWTQQSGTVKIELPAGAAKITRVQFRLGMQTAVGEFWATGLVASIGNRVVEWSENPLDTDARIDKTEARLVVTEKEIGFSVKKGELIQGVLVNNQGVKIDGKNVDIKGLVTFDSFDTATKNEIDSKAKPEDIQNVYEQATSDTRSIQSGNPIYTDKADDAVVHVEVDGKSVQNSGSGKNIATHFYNADTSGQSQTSTKVLSSDTSKVLIEQVQPNTQYTISRDKVSNRFRYFFFTQFPSVGSEILSVGGGYLESFDKGTFTVPDNANYVVVALGDSGSITWVQLEKGSVVTAYEPPAPSPDAPIPINSLDKSFDIVSSVGGRNLISNSNFKNGMTGWQNGGITTTVLDGIATSTITATGTYTRLMLVPNHLNNKSGDKLYLSFKIKTKYINDSFIRFASSEINSSGIPSIANEWTNVSWILQANKEQEAIWFSHNTASRYATGESFQWKEFVVRNLTEEYGIGNEPNLEMLSQNYSQAPEDIPYDTQTPTLYKTNILLSEPLRSVGDVKDRVYLDEKDGKWKVERNVGEVNNIRTTSGSWTARASNNPEYMYFYSNQDKLGMIKERVYDAKSPLRFNNFKTLPNQAYANVAEEGVITWSDQTPFIFVIKLSRIGLITDANINEWLSKNPTTVQYELKTPTIETLPQSEQVKLNNIQSFKGSNYVYTVDSSGVFPELHGAFKSSAWYANAKVKDVTNSVSGLENVTLPALSDGLLNKAEKESIKQSLNIIETEKKGFDAQYNSIYANTNLTGTQKTNLANAKTVYNTAFNSLSTAVNAVLNVADNVRISQTLMNNVQTAFTNYGTAIGSLQTRLEEASDMISSKQANTAQTEAEKYTDAESAKVKDLVDQAKDLANSASALAGTKAKTFTTTPTTPYASGDVWRNGSAVYISTATRATGSYVVADWVLVGDVTSNNTAKDTASVGGTASTTIKTQASNGNTAYGSTSLWQTTGRTTIDGGQITTDSITSGAIKSDVALINKLFVSDANINVLTGKSAFINSVKAVDISADRIKTGILSGITINSPFNYSYDGAIMNQGMTTMANGEISMGGKFTHAFGGTFMKINPDTIYAENLQSNGNVRSMFKLSGVGLELNVSGKTAKYTQDGIYFESGGNASVKYNTGDARIEISSYNGVSLGVNSSGTFYYRISTGGGQDGLAPFVDIWTDLNLRSTLNVGGNTVKNAAHITGVKDILFANTSNRIVQGNDNILNIMSPAQIDMGYTNGTITSNSLVISNWGTQFQKQVHFNGNQINGASNIRGVKTMLFDGSSNRIVQGSDGFFNILAPIQLNLGWTDGTNSFNTMVITQNQIVARRNINMDKNEVVNTSDKRLKEKIIDSDRVAIDAIKAWNFVEYQWKNDDRPFNNQFGLIAQDTPELMVFEEEDDYYAINTSRQIMLNSKGVQELSFKNDEQDSRVDDLEEKIKELETIIREMGK